VALGDKWLAPDLVPDPAWQQPLPGKDRPLQKAYKYMVPKSKGIILHVHGCDGRGGKVFSDVWGAYFNALGFDFIVPDSFAVKRPKPVCGYSADYPAQQVSDVTRLRVKQTQQTLAGLRKSNPGKPIYLWGHSEGGFIVQLVEAKVEGIIVSGEECGAYGAPPASGPDVPLLYLWGEFDRFVNGLGLFKVEKNGVVECRRRMNGYNVEAALLAGRGHNPFPWIQDINEAVAQFLKVQPVSVSNSGLTKKMARSWKQTRVDKRYRKASQHRAAAINPSGASYMVWGLDNPEDAKQLALFGCALSVGKKTNVFTSGKHICALVDVNGAAPK
jgi:pimeloyl-ACP methyl ester carboxylesterase